MPTPCWLKHICSIRALVPVSCSCSLSLSLSLSLRLFLWSSEALWVHFPTEASKTLLRTRSVPSPHREGAWGLCEQSKPHAGALMAFCVNHGLSASFSLLYFLIDQLRTTRFWSIKGPQHFSFNITLWRYLNIYKYPSKLLTTQEFVQIIGLTFKFFPNLISYELSSDEYVFTEIFVKQMELMVPKSTSWETLDWKKHKLESRLPGEISLTSDR